MRGKRFQLVIGIAVSTAVRRHPLFMGGASRMLELNFLFLEYSIAVVCILYV